MVIHAALMDVNFGVITGLELEEVEVEILDHISFDEFVAPLAGVSHIRDHLAFLT